MRILAIFFVISILGIGFSAHAQTSNSAQPDPVQYIVTPEIPGPYQLVHLELQGVGSFLGNSKITWKTNGVVTNTGIGDRTLDVTTGGLGTQTIIQVQIVSPEMGTIIHNFILSPSLVNLIWEANTTVPSFYKGKALYSGGSLMRVSAFPEIAVGHSFLSAKALSFQWSLNDTIIPEQSGLNDSTFTFQGDQLKDSETVAVDIYIGNTKVGHGETTIPASSPELYLYNLDPLRGEILDFALPNAVNLISKELTVQAEPYYFSNTHRSSLSYTWAIDGNETSGPDSAHGILTLRQNGQGLAILSLGVQNIAADQLVQSADTAMKIFFGQLNTGTSFGL